jgi:hypothetical protein
VRNKLSIGFDCFDHQQVKNVAAPVMSYRVTGAHIASFGKRLSILNDG